MFFSCKNQESGSKDATKIPINVSESAIESAPKFRDVDFLSKADLTKDYSVEIKRETKFFFESDNIEVLKRFDVDKNGVVILEDGSYFPTAIAQMGLRAVNHYRKTGSTEAKKILLNQAKWAKENFTDFGDYGFWIFTQPQPAYLIDKPWTSGMGQGEMISFCIGAYEVTKEEVYLSIIEKALKGFLIPMEDGGFLINWEDDEVWFEEYATQRPSRVLNGFIFALAGVHQAYEASDNELALKIFSAGIRTLKNHLSKYNAGYTSRYNLADWKNEVAQEHYHEIHIFQLLWLYRITGDPYFKEYAQIFLENDRGDFMRNIPGLFLGPKIASITAKDCIDCEIQGPANLHDELWAYGNYWSSYQNSELIIDFGKIREKFYGINLFHMSKISSEIDFDLYAFDDSTEVWQLKQRFFSKKIKDKISSYNQTSDYETFIEYYKVFESVNTSKIKLIFHTDFENIVALREINFMFDCKEEIEYLLVTIDKLLKDIYY